MSYSKDILSKIKTFDSKRSIVSVSVGGGEEEDKK